MKEYLRCSKVLFFSFEFCWSTVTQMSLEEVREKNQWLADLARFFTGTCICLWHVLADTLINHNMKKNSPQCRSCLILTTCWFFFWCKVEVLVCRRPWGCFRQKDHWLLLSIDISLQLSVQKIWTQKNQRCQCTKSKEMYQLFLTVESFLI